MNAADRKEVCGDAEVSCAEPRNGIHVVIALGVLLGSPSLGANDNVHLFAAAPQFAMAQLSPDGKRLSYVRQSAGLQYLVLRTLANGAEARRLSVDPARERVRWCDWAGARFVLCGTAVAVRRPEGIGERTRLYSVDADRLDGDDAVRELNTGLDDPIHDHVIDLILSRPTTVLLQHDPAGRGYPEVAELDVATGGLRRLVRPHPPVSRWMSDGLGGVRLGLAYEDAKSSLFVRTHGDRWSLLLEQSPTDLEAVAPLAVNGTNEMFALKHHNGRAALFRSRLDRSPSDATLVFAHPNYDVAGPVTLDPQTGAPLAVRYVGEHEMVHTFEEAERRRRAWIDERLPETVNLIIDRSEDGRLLLVRSGSDVNPPSLYLVEPDADRLDLVGHEHPGLETRELSTMRPVAYRARDGQKIPAYLTLPRASDRRAAVVLPHGGPEARDWRTFDALVQFLAAEGYVVLQMNYRGSLGYGAGFAAAGAGQWGGTIHSDITDGARWLIKEGIADPARICIVGASFGGYAALLGAARESQWYACAASFAGVSDLLALSQYTERLQDAELWRQRLGGSARALWQMSPLARVHGVETPVLLMHGRYDPVTPVTQSRRFARALRASGKPHRLIERSDCDHAMTVEPCRRAFFTELQGFLAEVNPSSEPP